MSDASQEAFAAGMYVSAGLLAAGGLIALAGIRRPVPVTPSVADTSHAEA